MLEIAPVALLYEIPAPALRLDRVIKFAPLVRWLVFVGIVRAPVVLLYAPEPAVKLRDALARASVYCVIVVAIAPEVIVIPVPALKWARTSEADGPVYVITPVVELYASEPSPPLSVIDTAPLALAFVK